MDTLELLRLKLARQRDFNLICSTLKMYFHLLFILLIEYKYILQFKKIVLNKNDIS